MTFPDRVETSRREVQVVFGGVYVAKTRVPLLVWDQPKTRPQYYLPEDSLLHHNIQTRPLADDTTGNDIDVGQDFYELAVGGRRTVFSAFRDGLVNNYIKLHFDDMDAWFEDGALTRLPPKNPSRRIDTAVISAHIEVSIANIVVAMAEQAVVLYETGLQPRHYLPATSIRDWKAWRESEKKTACPYKGEASYFSYSTDAGNWDDVAWYYLYPLAESSSIGGRLAFDGSKERVRITVNGTGIDG